MARKFDLISELYDRTCKTVVSYPERWQSFLSSACNNFRLRFDEQLLVFAQRPKATAVLEIEKWNKGFGRWVNRGANGIAVFEDSDRSRQRLLYYFDIADTHRGQFSRDVPIWQMKEKYAQDVIETLENTFGAIENKTDIGEAVIEASKYATDDNIPDYLGDLKYIVADSFLEDLDEENIEVIYRTLVSNSVAYMIMTRLGLDADEYFDREDFQDITNFNTPETLNALGFATSDIAEMGLAEIAKTVISLDKENRIIAQSKEVDYNKSVKEIERSYDNDRTNLHNAGRLQSPEPDNAEPAGNGNGQIRTASQEISKTESQSSVLQSSDEVQNERASVGNSAESNTVGRNLNETDVSSGGLDGRAESKRYDDLGSQNEQSEKQSSGNRDAGSNIQLEYYDRSNEDKSIEFLHKDSDIKAILLNTLHLKASKDDIAKYFEKVRDRKEQTEYIKSIFNNDLTELTVPDGRKMGYKTYQNVLHMWEGSFDNKTKQSYYDWAVIAAYFDGMRLLKELSDTVKPLPSMESQLNFLNETGETKAPVFSFSQEIIDAVLTRGSGVSQGKMRIYEQFQKSLSKKENISFLKNEYGWGGSYPIITGTGIDENHDGKGIQLSKGFGKDAPKLSLTWAQVEKRIGELIKLDRYLNPKEKDYYPQWLDEQEQRRALWEEEKRKREILSKAPPETKAEELQAEKEYEYHLGDKVYIGASEYEITSFDDNRVTLFDSKFPLFGSEMPKAEFDAKVQENPMNDHLLKKVPTRVVEKTKQENKASTLYSDYLKTKNDNLESIVLYQVGDFFEAYNDDAVAVADALDLTMTSRQVNDGERVPMVGVPNHRLETYINMLTDRGFDITVSALENNERKVYSLSSQNKENPVASKPIGRIDYLSSNGAVRESIEYTSPYQFEKDIKEENHYGVPMSIYVYSDENGQSIPHSFIAELDPPPQGFSVIKSPYLEDKVITVSDEEKQKSAPIVPSWEQPKNNRAKSFDLHADIPMSERHNFDLKSNEIEVVNKKERFHRNYAAIKVLKDCQSENRFATPDEQIILSKYVGWGGIPEAFDERADSWKSEYTMLKNILTDDEYAHARESTLTAFYTPPTVIGAMYKVMEQLGFKEGNILEPSCGIGHFIGMLPESMKESKVYGVELDTISAGIAQQLYQKSSIAGQGYEEVNLPDSFFDAVVGNVPFGDFKVIDKRYDKHKFLIHDYFFAKSLDKLRPGGVMALITSKGTMDKENSAVRKYIAQRADLLGAIRLPNNTFKGNAGTEVVSDILILQKRDRLIDIEPDWVHLGQDENGISMNSYFVEHPEMILGEMKMVSGRFGPESSCVPFENADLETQLSEAITNIHGQISEYERDEEIEDKDNSIPADPTVRNFSYTIVDDKIYFRENSKMTPVEVSATAENRIKGMIAIRNSVRSLIELQTEDYPDSMIKAEQENLNRVYDSFTKKYGLINSRANVSAFSQDSSFSLLSALEVIGDDGQLERKADMFFKRTIKPHIPVTSVDTASEALAVSMGEKATVDMEYMISLTGKKETELYEKLKGVIFLNPKHSDLKREPKYLIADEYLSGNVREKLAFAKKTMEVYGDDYKINVEALEKVQPKDLTASEISVRLGATWLPVEIVQQFMFEFLGTPRYSQWNIKVHFSQYTGEWNIEGKSYDRGNIKAYSTYGTSRINAYKIIEETLNLKDVRIFDYVEEADGKRKAVLNKKETAIAQSKQELIKQGFQDFVWKDPQRREKLTKLYNEKFNSIRPREYDGSHITFNGMNPEIELREHQKNAVAHILYGGNTLLAHAVGAGKTFEMTAAAMESKRLGLCNKSMFVVPNHLTEQWATEFLQLYPAANILVATKKDFETKNRKRFCGRIATGDYDAVIIGHSQFEKIPMSTQRQKAILEQQLDEITEGIADLKRNRGDNFSVKQLERTKKSVKQKLDKLNDQSRKDDVVTFEELGVDRIFIDESHYYKNLFLYTKMRNVGGIAQTEAQKSSDLFMKCRYLDEITGGRGTVFATGTPISNSMVELYTIQRYLQYNTLVENNLQHFDSWASTFGETVTAVELTPEGTGYRAKTRFARFYNLPELMSMFKEVADIKTADMLNLPVPKANFHNISVKPSEMQKEMVAELSKRADKVRNGMVDSSVDNMLKITNDGRKLALDQRLINESLPDYENSKLNACVDNIYRIWEQGKEKYSAQLFFCDLSTPKGDESFSVYTDIRKKLIERGVPESEVRFIHEADTEAKKLDLFKKTRKGEVRLLMGSTQKMGAGTNVQNKLVALHDLDCPWRPSDLEQRLGRIVRQGNENTEVDIFRYVTEETFDAYLYQLVEGKQKFASQIMTSKSPVRSCEDIDETALSYAEIKMLATGNPHIKEKMDLDIQVQKLRLLKSNFLSEKYALEDKIIKFYPQEIARRTETIAGLKTDILCVEEHPKSSDDTFVGMTVKGVYFSEKADAGNAILEACSAMTNPNPINIGEYRGFQMELLFDTFQKEYQVKLKGELSYTVSLGTDTFGNITRLDNVLESLPKRLENVKQELENSKTQLEVAKVDAEKPFVHEEELKAKTARLNELNALLNVDKKENEIVAGEPDEGESEPSKRKEKSYER